MEGTHAVVAVMGTHMNTAEEIANTNMIIVVVGTNMGITMIGTAMKREDIIIVILIAIVVFIAALPHVKSVLRRWRPIFESCRLKSRQSKNTLRN
jgi:hypothetical protein